ncbi:hypothetical protein ACFWZ2_08390 [Streptomyces sp. NPDC059002]|uniref:allene oxide cyclase barrel-like domain-containing protein n=1 Tax=Streptomyces sp. NPDC059002 TaxID=3346690 RepID=UPI0036875AF1
MGNNNIRPMLRKFGALSLVTAAVGVFAVGSADADTSNTSNTSNTSKRDRVEVVELQIKDLKYEAVDVGAKGPSLGDMGVYCGTALENGREVGSGSGTSQVVSLDGGNTTEQSVITIDLDRGTLTMQSLRKNEETSLDMAITGGTGAFNGARGTARYWDIGTPKERLRAEILR